MSESKLVRGIGRWDLTAIAINAIIGTGIFILPARIDALIGSYSLIAFIACAVIVGFIVICFAEVSSRFQTTGGMYLYAREAFGAAVGFEVGWLYWIVRVTTFAANVNAFLIYLKYFWPAADEGIARFALISSVVVVFMIVNILGVRQSAVMTNVFTVGKMLPLILFALVGLFFVNTSNFSFAETPSAGKFSEAVLLLIYAFVGFETAVIPAGETKNPEKNVPFALIAALIMVAVLFILIQIVAIGTLPGLPESKTPLADAAGTFAGGFGATFIVIGALISVLGNLNGGFLAASRLPYAMAEQKELPEVIGRTHEKFKTPHVAIILTAAAILVLSLQSSFYTAVTIAVTTRLLVFATTCAALIVFRRRTDVPEAAYRPWLGIPAAVISLGLIVWLLANVDYTKEGVGLIVATVLGLLIYFAYRIFSRRGQQ